MNNKDFGQNIKKIRKDKKFSIRQLALQSGMSHPYISQIENGLVNIPKPATLEKLAKGLRISKEEIFKLAGLEVSSNDENNEDNLKIASRLNDLQRRTKISNAKIADALNISEFEVSQLLNGNRNISATNLTTLSDLFGVSADYILGRKVKDDNLTVAAHIDDDDLTDAEKQEINDYIEFKKAQYRKRHNI